MRFQKFFPLGGVVFLWLVGAAGCTPVVDGYREASTAAESAPPPGHSEQGPHAKPPVENR